MKAFWITIIVLAAILIAGAVYIFFGIYNVSATRKEGKLQEWLLSSAMDNSVKRHAKGIIVPVLGDSAQVALGYEHFKEMCVTCHGAPGVLRSEIGRGLNPEAPDLPTATTDWSDAELFWIVKNGIKMTGMPAFEVTHSNDQIWAMIAFVRRLEKMTPEEYGKLEQSKVGE